MQFVRVYTGEDGETHFEDLQIQFQEVAFAPPAPPVLLTPFTPATQWAFFSLPPGWYGDWHPTPRRQIFFYLSGEAEAEVSDGTVRRFRMGDATIVEDTTGKGHRSRVVGDQPLLLAVVQMPDIS
jgi:quercetin dioxygenase-like cupin family protein